MKEETNIEFWERVLKDLPDSYRDWFKEEEKYLRANISQGSRVLEVGCGEGRSLKYISNIAKELIGIDHDNIAVEDAKRNFEEIEKVKILQADARKIPFEKSSFDFVISMTTPANFGDHKYEIYEEMKRVVKEEGEIILSVFNEDAFEERMKLYKKLEAPMKEVREDEGTVVFDDSLIDNSSEQFSESQLREIFEKVGLEVIEIKKSGIGNFCRLRKKR